MQSEMTLQTPARDASGRSDRREPYRAPECRALMFRSVAALCETDDLNNEDPGTGNSGEGPGYNNPDYYGNGN